MAKINKQEVIQKLIDELNLYPGKDMIPSELADKILAVYQINAGEVAVQVPYANVIKSAEFSDVDGLTTKTVYTTPATGKFYLTSAFLDGTHIVANDFGWLNVTVVVDGATVKLAEINKSTITLAGSKTHSRIFMPFNNPILLDPGSVITMNRMTADEGMDVVTITGYTD